MFAHDNETIFYPVAGDRVFTVSIAALVMRATSCKGGSDGAGTAPTEDKAWHHLVAVQIRPHLEARVATPGPFVFGAPVAAHADAR